MFFLLIKRKIILKIILQINFPPALQGKTTKVLLLVNVTHVVVHTTEKFANLEMQHAENAIDKDILPKFAEETKVTC